MELIQKASDETAEIDRKRAAEAGGGTDAGAAGDAGDVEGAAPPTDAATEGTGDHQVPAPAPPDQLDAGAHGPGDAPRPTG
jgi:hypothetical protein